MRAGPVLLGAFLLISCASAPLGPGWTYRTNYGVGDPDRPIALYGWPETLAVLALECDKARRGVQLVSLDVAPFAGPRPLTVRAGRARWTGSETLEPPDAVTVARALLPLDHAVLDAFARGAPMHIERADGRLDLESGPVPIRTIRECRRLAG